MRSTVYRTGRPAGLLLSGEVPTVAELRAHWRSHVLPTLRGHVLDVGAGDGSSVRGFASDAQVTSLEPHAGSARRLQRRVGRRPGSRVLRARAEAIPLEDAGVDAVVCCAALCSVDDQAQALDEIARVLRPAGRLVLLEHVAAAPGTWLRKGQRVVAPFSRLLDHGCDPARDTEAALSRSTLDVVELRRVDALGPWGARLPHLVAELTRAGEPTTGRS